MSYFPANYKYMLVKNNRGRNLQMTWFKNEGEMNWVEQSEGALSEVMELLIIN